MNEWLGEQIKTVKCLCLIAEILIEHDREYLLPTILELAYEQMQTIIEENCIVVD